MAYKRYFILPVISCFFLGGCKFTVKRTHDSSFTVIEETGANDEIIVAEAEPDNTTPVTAQEMETFYQSLPSLGLPLKWNDEDFENEHPVADRIYRSPYFGFDYTFEVFNAARLPEVNGVRSVIVTIADMSDYLTRYLYTFRAEDMENIDQMVFYNVREIDGGQNTLVTLAEIDENMLIDLSATYAGNGRDGKFERIVFFQDYLTVSPDGTLQRVFDPARETIDYTETEDETWGESYPSYNFTVTNYRPRYLEEEDTWEMEEYKSTLYTVNDESWLVEVDSFN